MTVEKRIRKRAFENNIQDVETVYVPIEFEDFMSYLFGKQAAHGKCGHTPVKYWKKYLSRIFEHLEKYVEYNVSTDATHMKQIRIQLKALKDSVSDINREAEIIRHLMILIFDLLGGMPNHWTRKVVNQPTDFQLNKIRSLAYTVSSEQKAQRIYNRSIWPKLQSKKEMERKDGEELMHVYFKYKQQENYSGFLAWFEARDKDSYRELIC